MFDPGDPEYQEELARQAYYRLHYLDAVADQEHEMGPAEYFCVRWEQLSSATQRPFRVAVEHTLTSVAELISA